MKKRGTMSRLFGHMGKLSWLQVFSALFVIASAVMNMLAYVSVYEVAVLVLDASSVESVDQAAVVEQGWRAVSYIMGAFGVYGMGLLFSHLAAFNTVARLRSRIVEHLGKLPLGYFSMNSSGKLRKIVETNTDNIENTIAHTMPDFVNAVTLPVVFIAFMFSFDWRLSLASLLPLLIGFLILARMLKDSTMDFYAKQQKSAEDMANATTEFIRGISVVKVFGQTASSFARYRDAVGAYRTWMLKYALSMRRSDSLYMTVINSSFLFLVPTALMLGNGPDASSALVGSFVFFCALIPMTITLLTRIMNATSNLIVSGVSLDAVDEILAEEPLRDDADARCPSRFDLELNHVSFRYEPDAPYALHDVSLRVPQGSVVALVGQSGGGKSTIANLIARFWDAQEGVVSVGGVDVRKIPYAWLAESVGIVFQQPSLFHAPVSENVAMAKAGADADEVSRALSLAQCDDILAKLPEGEQVVIGAAGTQLSGGEQQRIVLARAILKDAPIVLLDEATAFADAENERLIQQALTQLLRGKTVLMIAHRLSTVVNADLICVVDGGHIIERGTHEDLLAADGAYARMYREYETSVSWKIGGGPDA